MLRGCMTEATWRKRPSSKLAHPWALGNRYEVQAIDYVFLMGYAPRDVIGNQRWYLFLISICRALSNIRHEIPHYRYQRYVASKTSATEMGA